MARRPNQPASTLVQATTAAQRMLWASQLYMTGLYSFEQIAERLQALGMKKVTVSQISQDLKYLREQSVKLAVANVQEVVEAELRKLDMLEAAAFENLQQNPDHQHKYTDAVLRIMQRRAALLGLDKAKRVELTGAHGKDLFNGRRPTELSDDDLEKILIKANAVEMLPDGDGVYNALPPGEELNGTDDSALQPVQSGCPERTS